MTPGKKLLVEKSKKAAEALKRRMEHARKLAETTAKKVEGGAKAAKSKAMQAGEKAKKVASAAGERAGKVLQHSKRHKLLNAQWAAKKAKLNSMSKYKSFKLARRQFRQLKKWGKDAVFGGELKKNLEVSRFSFYGTSCWREDLLCVTVLWSFISESQDDQILLEIVETCIQKNDVSY